MKRREFLWTSAGAAAGDLIPSLSQGQVRPCPPPALQVAGGTSASTACGASSAGAADWLARSTGPGVIWAHNFESESAVSNYRFTNSVGLDKTPAPGSTGSYVRWNSTGGILGKGCLELEQRADSNMNSYWCRPFNPALTQYQSTGAGGDLKAGEGFYVQLRVKSNCGGGGGASGPNGSNGGEGRKVFSVSRTENSYTLQEVVAQDTYYRGVYQMYQGQGVDSFYQPLEVPVAPYDYNFQPNSAYPVAPKYCSYAEVGAGNRTNCWTWGNSEWITYQMYVLPANDKVANGQVTVWGWKSGMSGYVKILERTSLWMHYDTDKVPGFNAVILWIYETGRTGGPAGQKQWYDQVILSRSPIACPTV